MSACPDCRWYLPLGESAICILEEPISSRSAERDKTGRACIMACLYSYLDQIRGRVLEIGPGVFQTPQRIINMLPGTDCVAIDPRWGIDNPRGRNLLNMEVGTMDFPDGTFDWVWSTGSIEHWAAKGMPLEECIAQIHRVLKPGGRMMLLVAIHEHGDGLFLLGRLEEIRRIYASQPWRSIDYTEWRRDFGLLKTFQSWRKHREVIRQVEEELPGQSPITWYLEALAVK